MEREHTLCAYSVERERGDSEMEDCNCKRMAAMDNSTTAAVSKRRKITASTPPLPPLPPIPTMLQLLDSPHSCSSFCSDHSPPPSSCSSPLLDLEAKSFETAFSNSTSIANNKFRETTPSSELCLDSDEMSSPAPAVSHRRRIPVSKSPASEEIEEFFAAAEKYEHKRFTEQYNYDIVKDVPLEGRYQWVGSFQVTRNSVSSRERKQTREKGEKLR